ncbi:MAG: hypothetical protein ACOYOK_08950 [Pseudobdellovibrionaceae bacterium]
MYEYNFFIHICFLVICGGAAVFHTILLLQKNNQKLSFKKIIYPGSNLLKLGLGSSKLRLIFYTMSVSAFGILLYPMGSSALSNTERLSVLVEAVKIGVLIFIFLFVYSRWVTKRKPKEPNDKKA